MPHDNHDIMEIYQLWKRRKKAQGTSYESIKVYEDDYDPFAYDDPEPKLVEAGIWKNEYDYHLCHLDPVKGEDFQGRLTANNLVIAPASVNQSLGNSQVVDHGYRACTGTPAFKDNQAIKAWCTNTYDIAFIAQELKLKPKSKEKPQGDIQSRQGHTTPSQLFVEEVNRLGGNWKANKVIDPQGAFEEFLKSGIQGSSYIEHHYGEYVAESADVDYF